LVLWGGALPPELVTRADAIAHGALQPYFVIGSRDKFVNAERLAEEEQRMRDAGIRYHLLRYTGGHSIPAEALLMLAGAISSRRP
jgi:predicted esterase